MTSIAKENMEEHLQNQSVLNSFALEVLIILASILFQYFFFFSFSSSLFLLSKIKPESFTLLRKEKESVCRVLPTKEI